MRENFSESGVLQVIKAVLVALICSVALTAIFALILRVCPLGHTGITVVTQVLKSISLAVGILLFMKGKKGLIKGIVSGVAFCMLGYLTFAMLGGGFALSWLIVCEMLLFCAVGGLCGVAAVNIKKG